MSSSQPSRTATRILACLGAIALLSTLFLPAASAAHTNSVATLSATQQGDPDGTGIVDLRFDETTGEVCFAIVVADVDTPTSAHIHDAVAGTTGDVVVDFDVTTNGLTGCVTSTPAQVLEITAAPADYYVNIHNADFPAGALRAQVGDVVAGGLWTSTTALTPNADPPGPAGDAAGSGSIDLTLNEVSGEVCYDLTTAGLTSVITGGHIHTGDATMNGGVLVNLGITADGSGCVSSTAVDVATILADEAGHYVNIHTADHGDGAIRGQVADTTTATKITNFAVDGLGFGDPDGSGAATLTMYPGGNICFNIEVTDVEAPTAAHIHEAAEGSFGDVVVDFDVATNGLKGCVESTDAQIEEIEAMPSDYYVNVHNAEYPAGAVRGQLTATTPAPATTALRLPLMPTGDTDGSGIADVNIDPATGRTCFSLLTADIDTVTSAHIHEGATGVDGGVVIDLDIPTNGTTGCVFADMTVAMAVAADLPGHYLNVHTAEAPAGAIRSQLDAVLLCNGLPITIDLNLTPGALATTGDDVIQGTPGDDSIDALDGNDSVCGWSGNDELLGGNGDDYLSGENGNDIARGGPDVDMVIGGLGDDRLLGGIGDDTLDGGEGDDYLGGFGGDDTINAGAGNDTVFGGFGADVIDGGDGNDNIRGLIGDDTINGGAGDDMLFGDRGNDTINGGDGDDSIGGGNAKDTINGDAGDDTLGGGKADDTLSGGDGTDSCSGNLDIDTADATCEFKFSIEINLP